MAEGLYLGKVFDPVTEALGEDFRLRASDLTTHGIVIGMTGSGKTGLSVVMIEEALQAGIPVIAIDPKGDMGNLALAFPQLREQDFTQWVDADAAVREGKTREQAGAEAAAVWTQGLTEWGLGSQNIASYVASREVRIITPGSLSGIPLNLIESLEPPSPELDEEEFRDQVDAVVTAFLGLLGIPADPVESREYIFLFNLIENAWRQNQALTLEGLIGQVASPPIDKLGALPLDVVYPPADRNKLMLSLNNLLASPPLAAWRTGEPVDIGSWFSSTDGRARLNVVYTAHLEEEQRIFVTALILNKIVSWVRQQPGTSDLRCLLYMDEIFGYFPPTANPPTKKPLITLLKQARAYGLGVLLSTQNPVDLDYRGLANMGFWAIGRLQTSQDQARIKTGIEAALEDSALGEDFDSLISGVQKRVFLIHDIHRREPSLVHSRFAMSYLRGPLTRNEIELLTAKDEPVAGAAGVAQPAASAAAAPVTAAAVEAVPPPLPAPLRSRYLELHGGNIAHPHLYVKAAVRYKVGTVHTDESQHSLAFRLDADSSPAEVVTAEPLTVDDDAIADAPASAVTYAALPMYIASQGVRTIERALRERLDDQFALELLYDPETKMVSMPTEGPDDFALRVANAPAVANKRRTLETRLQSKRAALSTKQGEVKARGMEKWASIGTSILSNMSIFTGRKRTVTGVGGVLSKQRMESTARSTTERLQQEIEALEEQLASLADVDTLRFETRAVKPTRNDVSILRYDILWVT
ncbi:MAG TPA: helicase HerA-like domain-containing protein [Dehalococcoidia bacterium]|nr:helicase HerA-like domain-containing protein [Dehalococcoidia bacterium]